MSTTAPAQDPARSVVSLSISFKKQIYKNRYYYLLLIPAIVYLAAISGIDTYVYRVGVFSAEFSFGAAVGLFKNVIGLVLLLVVNAFVRRFSEHALW